MTSTSLSILERARSRGDEQAWRDLEQMYSPLLRKWMVRYEIADSDADDLMQEVLFFVAERLSEFEHNGRTGAFRNWLRQALVNRLRKFWADRKQRSAWMLSFACGSQTTNCHDGSLGGWGSRPDDQRLRVLSSHRDKAAPRNRRLYGRSMIATERFGVRPRSM